jgi:hypothetical protein
MKYRKAFPDFDSELPCIEGFIDDSWRNDVCPSLYNKTLNLKLFCDYLNPEKRECGGKRYSLQQHDEEMSLEDIILESESLEDVLLAIEEYKKQY